MTSKGCLKRIQILWTHLLLCLGIIRPLVGQEGCKLARGSNIDVWVSRIGQTARIYAIYLNVALDEFRGSGHQGAGGRGSGLPLAAQGGRGGRDRAGHATRVEREMGGAERRSTFGRRCCTCCLSLQPGDSSARLYVPSSSHNTSRMRAIIPSYFPLCRLIIPGLVPGPL